MEDNKQLKKYVGRRRLLSLTHIAVWGEEPDAGMVAECKKEGDSHDFPSFCRLARMGYRGYHDIV